MIVEETSLDSARASDDLPLAVGPAIITSVGKGSEFFMFLASLIAANRLREADIAQAADLLRSSGARLQSSIWLEAECAADLHFEGDPAAARLALESGLDGIDVIVQIAADRRRALLIADMDSTMITVECIDELADYAGIKAQIAEVTERAMRGELDFEDALRGRVALLAGLNESVIETCLRERVQIMPGARPLIQTLRRVGGHAILVSGGFTRFAEPVAAEIGFHEAIANMLGIADGKLDGSVSGAIVGAATKRATLLAHLERLGLPASASIAVGDGANDIPMIEAAGLGVAYHAKPKTAAAAAAKIMHGDLSVLLYAMGYPRADWAV